MNESDFELVEGSGNVFRDLDDREADLKQVKATRGPHHRGAGRLRAIGAKS